MSERPATAASERTRSRNTELGDRACFCAACGWARRFYPGVVEPPEECPACGDAVVSACAACGADVLSVMAVDCDVCGESLRAPENTAGVRIRRPKRGVRDVGATVVPVGGDMAVDAAAPAPGGQGDSDGAAGGDGSCGPACGC